MLREFLLCTKAEAGGDNDSGKNLDQGNDPLRQIGGNYELSKYDSHNKFAKKTNTQGLP